MFRTVFVEIKRNIPFDSHLSLVTLQEIHGVNMGFHHYEKCGAISMVESMSAHMHRLFINHMLAKNLPFSIIMDGSTDSTGSHYLIVYFQILENDIPTVCFYRLIESTSDRTAKGIFDTLLSALQKEEKDLLPYFKRNLVGYASDGEPVMSGARGGVLSYVRGVAENPIYAIHCMAHRLELVIQKAFRSVPYFTIFESLINKLFQFYNWNASKRKTHLKETAIKCNLRVYEMNYIFKERWISSELQSIINLKKMWLLLTKDLDLISNDNTFDVNSRDKAKNLEEKIKGKKFLAILNFVADILQHLSFWSLKMQERTALLVDFSDFQEKIINTFEHLKNTNGKDLNMLLQGAKCDEDICHTIGNYYDSNVEYLGVKLYSETDVPLITEFRETFLIALINEIKSYFPSSDLKLFKVFRPQEIPSDVGEALTYGVIEIKRLCETFVMDDCYEVVGDWGNLLVSIIENEKFCDYKNQKTDTYAFWSFYLNEVGIVWTERTLELIRTVLVIPIGSADAERGFSVMNHIKGERRSRLTGKHVEDLMRIRINAPDDLRKFPAAKYAKKFLDENHYRTDDPKGKRIKPASMLDEEQNKKKFLPKLTFL